VVSKKVGKAVCRNKVKRRLRSLVREHEAEFLAGDSFVIIAKRNAFEASFGDLKDDFLHSIKKSRKRKENECS
jgi:ribonuclease P protein component